MAGEFSWARTGAKGLHSQCSLYKVVTGVRKQLLISPCVCKQECVGLGSSHMDAAYTSTPEKDET